jgi:hypothetical protein
VSHQTGTQVVLAFDLGGNFTGVALFSGRTGLLLACKTYMQGSGARFTRSDTPTTVAEKLSLGTRSVAKSG